MPIKTAEFDWRSVISDDQFSGYTGRETKIAIGWGDKGFFINTPTWADLTLKTALNAMVWPSDACLHVSYISENNISPDARSVRISKSQYQDLVEFILSTFSSNEPAKQEAIKGASYSGKDLFFEAKGNYHCLNTCNSWMGRCLRKAGVKVGRLTPMPKTVFLYLPEGK